MACTTRDTWCNDCQSITKDEPLQQVMEFFTVEHRGNTTSVTFTFERKHDDVEVAHLKREDVCKEILLAFGKLICLHSSARISWLSTLFEEYDAATKDMIEARNAHMAALEKYADLKKADDGYQAAQDELRAVEEVLRTELNKYMLEPIFS
ncbi:hypothetical protein BDV12DRAFT_194003 [Aspergillus spectabilis]